MVPTHLKKILVISPFANWPLSQGSIVRTYYLNKFLAQHHKIWFAFRGGAGQTCRHNVYVNIPNASHRFWQLFSLPFFLKLWHTMRTEKIDVIIVCQVWSVWHGILLHWFTGKPFVFDNHNVEYLRLRRMGHLLWPFMFVMEFIACHSANYILCVSEVDKLLLHQRLRIPLPKIHVAANGADVTEIQHKVVDTALIKQQLGLPPDEAMVLFFGSLDHRPNAQAADLILDEIVPRMEQQIATFVLVGLGEHVYLQSRQRPLPSNVVFTGFVEDITAVIKSADLVIVPLTSGSGTRFKIIESAACGRAIISTSIGAEGLDPSAFGNLLTICDDWDCFATQIKKKLAAPQPGALPEDFYKTYNWQNIFEAVDWSILDG